MANLITTCNNTLNHNLSTSNPNCFETENISMNLDEDTTTQQVIYVSQNVIALLGMVTNLVVVIVFLNHKEFRQKIPNIFIIHQVSKRCVFFVDTSFSQVESLTKTFTYLSKRKEGITHQFNQCSVTLEPYSLNVQRCQKVIH